MIIIAHNIACELFLGLQNMFVDTYLNVHYFYGKHFIFIQGVPMTSLRFLFDGKRINDDETPKQVN